MNAHFHIIMQMKQKIRSLTRRQHAASSRQSATEAISTHRLNSNEIHRDQDTHRCCCTLYSSWHCFISFFIRIYFQLYAISFDFILFPCRYASAGWLAAAAAGECEPKRTSDIKGVRYAIIYIYDLFLYSFA